MSASRPSFWGEWASEWDTSCSPSSWDTRQFMGGSEESPVSTAWMWGVKSPKHSSRVSNPEKAPNREKWGVQMWAGRNTAWGQASRVISSRSRLERPRMGRPSEWILPICSSRRESSSAASRPGSKITLCTFRVLSPCL